MTIINPNSIAGITSVTAEAGVMNFYKSDGTLAGLQLNGVNFNTTAGVSTFNNLYVGGVLTYEDVKNVDSIGIVTARDHIKITTDNKSLYLGASDDFQLFHNGSHNIIKSNNGNLYLQDDSYIEIGHPNGTVAAGFIPTGATNLRFNGNTKLATNNTGVTVTGTVAATSYTGDGSNLTSLPAQATIANNADNRVITGGSGVNLNGESNLTFNGTRLSVTGNVYVAGSQNAQLTTNQLIFDRAGYSYIDQINNAGSLVFRVTSSNTIGLRIDSNAQAIFGSSLIIPDAIQHEGDLDCKIRFPGTDTITFETASNERLRIDSSGNVMMGRTSASKKFSVRETSTSSGVYYNAQIGGANHVTGYAVGIAFDPEGYAARTKIGIVAEGTGAGYSRGKLHFLLDSANDSGEATLAESRMTITDSGYVGVKRSSPLANLHTTNNELAIGANPTSAAAPNATYDGLVVDGEAGSFINIRSRGDGNNSYGRVAFSDDTRSRAYIEYRHKDGTGDDWMGFATAGSERLRINSAGSMGLGTGANIDERVHFENSGNISLLVECSTSGSGSNSAIRLKSADSSSDWYMQTGNAVSGGLRFYSGSERLRIKSNGYVGINEANPQRYLHIVGNDGATGATIGNTDTQLVIDNQGTNGAMIEFLGDNNGAGHLMFTDTDGSNRGRISYHHNGDYLRIDTGGDERIRISSTGRTYINTSSPIDGNSTVAIRGAFGASGCGVEIKHQGNQGSNRDFIRFYNVNSAEAGSIEHTSTTAVAFQTSSDHRLKENIADITDGIERLKLLKPRKFSWIDDPELGLRDGFIAHEVSPVIPHCVSGEKDAVKEDGSIQTQTMEYSQLTPLLTAALQEAISEIETLKTKVAALEGS